MSNLSSKASCKLMNEQTAKANCVFIIAMGLGRILFHFTLVLFIFSNPSFFPNLINMSNKYNAQRCRIDISTNSVLFLCYIVIL
jgi:hypothetical protein